MKKLATIFAVSLLLSGPAWAEQNEASVGLQGGLMLPGMSPTSQTAFTLATWTVGVQGMYGVLDDLYITASFSFTTFEGDADGYTHSEGGLDYEGALRATTRLYHPQIGVRYKLYSGYNLAPYIDASVGYAWSTFHDPKLLDDNGSEIEVDIGDFSDDALTLTAGIAVDYRLMNTVFVGAGFYFTYLFGEGIFRNYFTVPVQVSYYW